MADLLSMITNLFGGQPQQPIAQDRYMRTPIYNDLNVPGAGASYDANSDAIHVNPDASMVPPAGVAHEVVHRIFNKAGLSHMTPELMPNLSKSVAGFIANSPIYKGIDPTTTANEGLAYSATDPNMMDKNYVNAAANLIKNNDLKNTLVRIFNNRQGTKIP